jgi:Mlc titration factor MtfA (ptsG expression regulator)
MAVIAARNSPRTLRALAKLHRYTLDGAYAESFDQYVCEKGHTIEPYLAALDPDKIRAECVREVESFLTQKRQVQLTGVQVDNLCAHSDAIRSHLRQSFDMVRHPPKSSEP